jgi:phosphopantetheine--protein transferase-like protein
MILKGIGIDIVDIEEVKELFERNNIIKKIFSSGEIESVEGRADRIIRLAGYFSAKEAVVKALQIPKESGLILNEIEIEHGSKGEPTCDISGHMRDLAGDGNLMISISHSERSAVGVAIWYL